MSLIDRFTGGYGVDHMDQVVYQPGDIYNKLYQRQGYRRVKGQAEDTWNDEEFVDDVINVQRPDGKGGYESMEFRGQGARDYWGSASAAIAAETKAATDIANMESETNRINEQTAAIQTSANRPAAAPQGATSAGARVGAGRDAAAEEARSVARRASRSGESNPWLAAFGTSEGDEFTQRTRGRGVYGVFQTAGRGMTGVRRG